LRSPSFVVLHTFAHVKRSDFRALFHFSKYKNMSQATVPLEDASDAESASNLFARPPVKAGTHTCRVCHEYKFAGHKAICTQTKKACPGFFAKNPDGSWDHSKPICPTRYATGHPEVKSLLATLSQTLDSETSRQTRSVRLQNKEVEFQARAAKQAEILEKQRQILAANASASGGSVSRFFPETPSTPSTPSTPLASLTSPVAPLPSTIPSPVVPSALAPPVPFAPPVHRRTQVVPQLSAVGSLNRFVPG
jgi:hypothetical protein